MVAGTTDLKKAAYVVFNTTLEVEIFKEGVYASSSNSVLFPYI